MAAHIVAAFAVDAVAIHPMAADRPRVRAAKRRQYEIPTIGKASEMSEVLVQHERRDTVECA
jgi:hypothetical protein